MANATEVIEKKFRNPNQEKTRKLTVATGVTIYEGTLVSIDASGNAVVAVTTARIAGIATETKTAGETVTVWFDMVVELALPSVAITDVGNTAYAADNQTAATSGTTAILGPIVDVGTNIAFIHLSLRA